MCSNYPLLGVPYLLYRGSKMTFRFCILLTLIHLMVVSLGCSSNPAQQALVQGDSEYSHGNLDQPLPVLTRRLSSIQSLPKPTTIAGLPTLTGATSIMPSLITVRQSSSTRNTPLLTTIAGMPTLTRATSIKPLPITIER
jgi:hypothetical protein